MLIELSDDEAYWLHSYLIIYNHGLFAGFIDSTFTNKDATYKMIEVLLDKLNKTGE